MSKQEVGVAEFRADCLKLIDQVTATGVPITLTKRGRAVAILSATPKERRSLIGAMRGTVLRYDDPFEPAISSDAWDAA